jgi:hypothetical protein
MPRYLCATVTEWTAYAIVDLTPELEVEIKQRKTALTALKKTDSEIWRLCAWSSDVTWYECEDGYAFEATLGDARAEAVHYNSEWVKLADHETPETLNLMRARTECDEMSVTEDSVQFESLFKGTDMPLRTQTFEHPKETP